MREFSHPLSEFTKGLRPDVNMPRNSGYATELYNSRCGVAGLEVPPLIVYPISGTPTVNWPLPQLVKINDLLLTSTGLYFIAYTAGNFVVSSVGTDYSLTQVYSGAGKAAYNTPYVWNPAGSGVQAIPPRFTIADFGYFQIWCHPALMLKRAMDGDDNYVWSQILIGLNGSGISPSVRCVCNFRGQLIAGMWTYYADTTGSTTDNLVAWSEIGSVNPTTMFNRTYSYIDRRTDDGGLVVQPYKRTSGNYRTGSTSTVYRVLPLGNGVMVYCSDKIFYMKAVSIPEPTFGIVPVADFGIPSTFCAEGDEHEHLIVDSSKDLWRVKEGPKLERLGYKEFIGVMSGTIVISKNPNYGDYYISNGSTTYLLSPFGLSKWFQYPTSLVWEDSNKRLIGPIAVASDVSASMASDVHDFGVRSIKTITGMETGGSGQVLTGNVDYKYKVTDATFTSSRFKTANNLGVITPLVSGVDFKFRVKGADYTKFDLDYLTIRYKYVDKRMLRGVYATNDKVLSRTSR